MAGFAAPARQIERSGLTALARPTNHPTRRMDRVSAWESAALASYFVSLVTDSLGFDSSPTVLTAITR
jgi:hypothetical protein